MAQCNGRNFTNEMQMLLFEHPVNLAREAKAIYQRLIAFGAMAVVK